MELIEALEQLSLQVRSEPLDQSITETGQNIGAILSLGRQIETIYKCHFMSQYQNQDSLDVRNCKKLCDTFISLCWTEPCVCDLPIIMRYSEYQRLLMVQINDIMAKSNSNIDLTNQTTNYENNESMSLDQGDNDDSTDCVFPLCDTEQLDNECWTTNRLYIKRTTNCHDQ